MSLPADPKLRKNYPVTSGVLDYFPDAIAAVADVSRMGNEQHNPGQPLHWSREKSSDHADCIGRHLIERGGLDTDGGRHSAKLAWRALALLQLELEAEAEAAKLKALMHTVAPWDKPSPKATPQDAAREATWWRDGKQI